jgi:hypothetical protein
MGRSGGGNRNQERQIRSTILLLQVVQGDHSSESESESEQDSDYFFV